jgi:DNA mismatch endonuclease, patch repair protein
MTLSQAMTRSRTMAAVPNTNTSLERMLGRELWIRGLRGWRRHTKLAGARPDFVFTRARVAVFVDGCFWHGCATCSKRPATNTEYWDAKIARNIERDAEQTAGLTEAGWDVVRIWGHELLANPARSAGAVVDAVRRVRQGEDGSPIAASSE